MKLIKGAKTWWRWWSTWLTAAGVLIFNLDNLLEILNVFIANSDAIASIFPKEYSDTIGTAVIVAGFLSRFIRQRKSHAIAEREMGQ